MTFINQCNEILFFYYKNNYSICHLWNSILAAVEGDKSRLLVWTCLRALQNEAHLGNLSVVRGASEQKDLSCYWGQLQNKISDIDNIEQYNKKKHLTYNLYEHIYHITNKIQRYKN